HAAATNLLAYVFGGDSSNLPSPATASGGTVTACEPGGVLTKTLNKLRAAVANGTVTIERLENQSVCGHASTVFNLRPNNGKNILSQDEANGLSQNIDACFNNKGMGYSGVSGFFSRGGQNWSAGSCTAAEVNNNVWYALDPEAVQLTANLSGSTNG